MPWLRQKMDQYDLWRGADHVSLKQVLIDFASYLYLPRLRDRQLLISALQGINQPARLRPGRVCRGL